MPSSNEESHPKPNRVKTGRAFEDRAAEFYLSQGFEIIARNWQAGHKEIDLIVRKDSLLVFVEVKSSRSAKFGHPSESVDRRKQERLVAAARQFIAQNELTETDFRFDVVTFWEGKMEHYPNAFEARY
jgi:putative endonuclease